MPRETPSGEVRLNPSGVFGHGGSGGDLDHENVTIGKAGRKPVVGAESPSRGVAKIL